MGNARKTGVFSLGRVLGLGVAALPLILGSPASAAAPAVKASHTWVATTDLGDGTFLVTYQFVFTNTGDTDVDQLEVEVIDSIPPSVLPGDSHITVGDIPIGTSVTVTGDITAFAPVDANTPTVQMIGSGEGVDGFGDPLGIAVVSDQEAAQ